MFIETRKQGKKKKYYLVHAYRLGDAVKRISRYLGSDLDKKELESLKKKAEGQILKQIKEKNILQFEISKEEIDYYKRFELKLEIEHLQKKVEWKRFTEDFTYNTNAIEGSTVAYYEVKDLIEKKELPTNTEEIETINVAKTIDFIKTTGEELSLGLIKRLHYLCFIGTKWFAGKLRNVEVVIKDNKGKIIHQGAPYKKIKNLLQELIGWYIRYNKKYPPLLLVSVIHNQFEKIHPFQDGNGRVGRLLLNYILLKHEYPPVNISLKDRSKYYNILQIYDKNGDVKPTIKFLISQYKKYYN